MTPHKPRVLLVEDEDLIAMLTEDLLDVLGYEVSVTAATLTEGLNAAEEGGFDVALLDVNLRGALSFPIADVLADRGIPFAFVSGYSAAGIDPRYLQFPRLQKPFAVESLEKTLKQILGINAQGQ